MPELILFAVPKRIVGRSVLNWNLEGECGSGGETVKATIRGGWNMAILDWSQCPAVESVPGRFSGAWVFRGTRLPVATVIENLEDLSIEEVMEQFDVTREQITAVLDFVAQSLEASEPETAAGPVDACPL